MGTMIWHFDSSLA